MRTIVLTNEEAELGRTQNNCRAATQKLIEELIGHWEKSHGEISSFWTACRKKYDIASSDVLVLHHDDGELSVYTAEETIARGIDHERKRRHAIFAAFGLDGEAHG